MKPSRQVEFGFYKDALREYSKKYLSSEQIIQAKKDKDDRLSYSSINEDKLNKLLEVNSNIWYMSNQPFLTEKGYDYVVCVFVDREYIKLGIF